MKELVIEIKGVVPFTLVWEEKRKAERYIQGEGLYAVAQDEHIAGLICAYSFREHGNSGKICDIQELTFDFGTVSDIAIHKHDEELKRYISDGFEKVLKDLYESSLHIENAFAEVNEGVKRIAENGGSTQGISEKTLLSALSIVTRGGTDNEEVK